MKTIFTCFIILIIPFHLQAAILTVTDSGDSGSNTLRGKIAAAVSGDVIQFSVSTVTLTSGELLINGKTLTIEGGGGVAIIRSAGGGTPQFRIFRMINAADVTMTDITLNNGDVSGSGDGGAIQLESGSTVTLQRCTANENSAQNGGAVNVEGAGSAVNATNCTISGNTASTSGGAISAMASGTATILNVTIANNTASAGAGGGLHNNSGTINIKNTIVAGNANTGGSKPDIDGAITSQDYNLIGNIGTESFTAMAGDQAGTSGSPINPLLGSLANNGGSTQTHALLFSSPAINAGTSAGAPATDQRGVGRAGNVDIGSYEFTFVGPGPLIANAGSGATICAGSSTVIGGGPTASGGTPPYSYAWSPAASLSSATAANPTASPLATTTYTVTVTDNLGATATSSVTVTVNPLPTANAGANTDICEGESAAIGGSPTASGGTPPYSYAWSPAAGLNSAAAANPVASPTATTAYTVTVTDDNGCAATSSVTVTVNPLPTASAGANTEICEGESVTIGGSPTASGGTPPYTYSWSPAAGLSSATAANPMASPTATTTYTVTVTDDKGCVAMSSVTVTVNPLPTVNAGASTEICEGESATIGGSPTASGGAPPYTYSWSPAAGLSSAAAANPMVSPTATTTYTVTVTDDKGCMATSSITVTVNPLPTADAGASTEICKEESATIGGSPTASGGAPPYTYSWSPAAGLSSAAAANPMASPDATTTYTVTVTDDKGCTATSSVTVTVNPLPMADAGPDRAVCAGGNASASTTIGAMPAASGGTPPYTYAWSPATGLSSTTVANPMASPAATTTYTLTVTDSKGCTDTDMVMVSETSTVAGAICWPLSPQNQEHRIWNGYGEFAGTGLHFHEGLDMPAAGGTSVFAVGGGKVIELINTGANYNRLMSVSVAVNNLTTGWGYVHMVAGAHPVQPRTWMHGDTVALGNTLGTIGTAGGILHHLHFEHHNDDGGYSPTGATPPDLQDNPINFLYPRVDGVNPTVMTPFHYRPQSQEGVAAATYFTTKTASDKIVVKDNLDVVARAYDRFRNFSGVTNYDLNIIEIEFKADETKGSASIAYQEAERFTGLFLAQAGAPAGRNAFSKFRNHDSSDRHYVIYEDDSTADSEFPPLAGAAGGKFFYILTNIDDDYNLETTDDDRYWDTDGKAGEVWNNNQDDAAHEADNNADAAFPDGEYTITVKATGHGGETIESTETIFINNHDETIESCDETGADKDEFANGDPVYVKGEGFPKNRTFNVLVVKNTAWADGLDVSTLTVEKTVPVTTDAMGEIPPTKILDHYCPCGNPDMGFDLFIDYDEDGKYTAKKEGFTVDVIDDDDVSGAGFISQDPTKPAFHFDGSMVTDVKCPDDMDGEIDLMVNEGTPPFTNQWSNGAATEDISNLKKGSYSVTVTDDQMCEADTTFMVEELSGLMLSVSGGGTFQFCVQDGPPSITLTASASGGTPPYNYSWPGGSLTVSSSGAYTVNVTDDEGCMKSATAVVVLIPIVCSRDPNDIIGPEGYSESRWISVNDNLPYTIRFENDPEFATAPAQKVVIEHVPDSSLNLFSLRLGDFGFANMIFEVPGNSTFYSQRLDVVDSLGVLVDVTAGIDVTANKVFWIFESVDPLTGLAPSDPFAGMLPVNDTLTRRGEGFVSFTMKPKSSSVTGDSVRAQAVIVFDINPPIETNIWNNIIDAVPPVSTLNPLPDNSDTTSVLLEWSGVDDTTAVGVSHYEVYVSQDGAPFSIHQGNVDTAALEFIGQEGSDYAFFIRAVDNVGNKEPLKGMGEDDISIKKGLLVSPTVYLQGAYNPATGLINDNLRANALLPLSEPYTALGYMMQAGEGGETAEQAVFDVVGADAIVDWVFLELRDKSDSTIVKATRSALLQRDGDVVDVDGVSPVAFAGVSEDDYYLVLRHRNHLGVMSNGPLSLSSVKSDYEFSMASSQAVGANPMAEVEPGIWAMWGGNANGDVMVRATGPVAINDYSKILNYLGAPTNIVTGAYTREDINMDGTVRVTGPAAINDYSRLLNILGSPTNIIFQPF